MRFYSSTEGELISFFFLSLIIVKHFSPPQQLLVSEIVFSAVVDLLKEVNKQAAIMLHR